MFTAPTFRIRRLLPSVYWVSFVDFVVALGLITSLWFFPSARSTLAFLAQVFVVLNVLGGLGWYWLWRAAGNRKPRTRPKVRRLPGTASRSIADVGEEPTGPEPSSPSREERPLRCVHSRKGERDASSPDSPELVECGTHSLKFHSLDHGRTDKVPCSLGHDVFRSGRISHETIDMVVRAVEARRPRPGLFIATSAVREAKNRDEFTKTIRHRLGLEVQVLSEWEEASLLARAYLDRHAGRIPALVADLGGGSLEVVHIGPKGQVVANSVPLGAVRLYQAGFNGGGWDVGKVLQAVQSIFEESVLQRIEAIHVTGGTMKAVSKILKRTTVTREDLVRLEEWTKSHGPPAGLKPARARVFLPGVLIIRKLLDFTFAETVSHLEGVSVGRTFLTHHRSRELRTLPAAKPGRLSWEIDARPATEPAKSVTFSRERSATVRS